MNPPRKGPAAPPRRHRSQRTLCRLIWLLALWSGLFPLSVVANPETFRLETAQREVVLLQDLGIAAIQGRLSQLPQETLLFIAGQTSERAEGRALTPVENTRLINRTPTLWQQYRWRLLGVLLLCVFQAGLLIALFRAGRERKRAIVALHEVNEGLERRVAERTAALRQSNARLAEAQAIARIGSWEWDLDADTRWWSEEVYRLFGARPDAFEPSYARFLEALHPDDRERVRSQMERAQRGIDPYDSDHRILLPDGKVRYVHERAVVDFDGDHKPVAMAGTVQDMTERVEIEAQLRKLSRAVEQSHSTIVIADHDALIEYANPAFSRITGYSLEEARGQNPRLLKSGEHDDAFYKRMWEILTRGEVWQGELHNKRKDGTLYWEFATISPVKDERGEITHYVAIKEDITQRRAAEFALQESQAKYQRLVDDIGDKFVIFSHTADTGEFLYVSEGILTVTGRSREEAIGKPWGAIIDWLPGSVERAAEYIERQIAGELDFVQFEMALRHPSGEVRTLLVSEHPVQDEKGRVVRMEGIAENITERTQADALLRASEEKLRGLFDLSPLGIALNDMQGRFIEFNDAFVRICGGYTAEELKSLDYWTLTPREYEPQEQAQLESLSRSGRYGPYEKEYQRKDGSRIPLRLNGVLVAGQDGQSYIWSLVEDISAQKEAQRHLQASRAQLQVALDEAQAVLDNTLVGIAFLSAERRFQRVNQALADLFGYPEEDLLGQTTEPLYPTPEDYQALGKAAYPVLVAGELFETERQMRRRDGSLFWCQIRGRAMQPGDLAKGFIWTLHDTSARYAFEQRLQEAKEAAESANRAKSAFLANMSHELRTPLNGILGYAQILQRDPELNAAQRQGVDTIRRSGDYLLTLINDVLDLAKIEAGFLDLFPGPCDLGRFFADLVELFQVRAREKGIAFSFQTHSNAPHKVEVDEKRLRQICLNLLGNAMKFTQRGEVRMEVDYRGGELWIQVTDTGVGIPERVREQIFRPFQQAGENQYKQQGTGLGLAISRSLVERMGGGIELESEEGRGSRFSLHIPVRSIEDNTAEPRGPGLEPIRCYRRTDGSQAPFELLVVDDVEANRGVLRGMLEPLGFVIHEAAGGAAAVAAAQAQPFDLILMDLVMPAMDGLTATRQILAQTGEQGPTILAISARAFAEDRVATLAAGCRDHLSKPLDEKALLAALRTHLPLDWEIGSAGESATAGTSGSSLDEGQREALLQQVRRGDIRGVRRLLEQLSEQAPAPSEAHELLTLARGFKVAEIRQRLEGAKGLEKAPSSDTAVYPQEWLAALEQAVIEGSRHHALELLAQQGETNTGETEKLAKWLGGYEYQRVLDWIERQAARRSA